MYAWTEKTGQRDETEDYGAIATKKIVMKPNERMKKPNWNDKPHSWNIAYANRFGVFGWNDCHSTVKIKYVITNWQLLIWHYSLVSYTQVQQVCVNVRTAQPHEKYTLRIYTSTPSDVFLLLLFNFYFNVNYCFIILTSCVAI